MKGILHLSRRLSNIALARSDFARARELGEESLRRARAGGDRYEESDFLGTLSHVEFGEGTSRLRSRCNSQLSPSCERPAAGRGVSRSTSWKSRSSRLRSAASTMERLTRVRRSSSVGGSARSKATYALGSYAHLRRPLGHEPDRGRPRLRDAGAEQRRPFRTYRREARIPLLGDNEISLSTHDPSSQVGAVPQRHPDRLLERLDALGPAPRAELLHVLMLPDFDRADRIGEFWG
jgi:hypothetical protein